MTHFVGLDVSLEGTSVYVVDETSKVVCERKVPTEPDDIGTLLASIGEEYGRVGIEAGPLPQCLANGLIVSGFPMICVETRHMKAMLQAQQVNKSDRSDGHTGSVPTTVLLLQVLDTVNVPMIASSGYRHGHPDPGVTKGEYLRASTDGTILTAKLDGIPQRMVRSKLMDRIEKSGKIDMWMRAIEASMLMKKQSCASWIELLKLARGMTSHGAMPLTQAMMAATMSMLIQKALVDGDIENGIMAMSVAGGRIAKIPSCQELNRPGFLGGCLV
ncbi:MULTISPECIES: hypothetical protein [Comamonas]|uniref:hypothetical protein n=1 Tax=Comamonas thiooxydans TaxID=363952 RepID=UPI0021140727|nr:hypothetical protein [Comamonas thiooxydans]UUE94508.1 hypothetical protein MJ608_02200 [Comamonas thiooxydans]